MLSCIERTKEEEEKNDKYEIAVAFMLCWLKICYRKNC